MTDKDDFQNRFVEQLSSSYGQMESVLGTDGYKVFIEDHRADQDRVHAYAERQRAIASSIRVIAGIGFLFSLPVMIYLWKWALFS